MRILAWSLAALLALLAVLAHVGGAIQWDREPAYVLAASWGGSGSGPGRFNEPTGIAVAPDAVFVADARNRRIQAFDRDGRFLREFGREVLQRPMNLSWRRGRLYAADFFADAIFVFDGDGHPRGRIVAADGLLNPGGVDVFADGSVLVADSYHHRVLRLSAHGAVLQAWGRKGQAGSGAGEFRYPTDVAIGEDGGFYVADGYNDRVQQFDAEGRYLRRWGGPFGLNLHGPFKGWFATVTSIALAPAARVLVADFYHDRVQVFSVAGGYRTSFGTPAGAAPAHTAIGVDVDAAGGAWITNFAHDRVEYWHRPEG